MENPFRIDGFSKIGGAPMNLEWLMNALQPLGAETYQGKGAIKESAALVNGITTDSRLVEANDLFIPIRGESQDGHKFIGDAQQKKAAFVLFESLPREVQPSPNTVLIRVRDTLVALGCVAAKWRESFSIPVLALTGSNGKTTTKEIAGAIFAASGTPLVTWRNLNNLLGVPLTLLRLRKSHTAAVIEMGMNQFDEIRKLTAITKPNFRLITNIMPVHLAGVGDLAGVARAKGEILEGLRAEDTLIVNEDDAQVLKLFTGQKSKKISYSLKTQNQTDVFLRSYTDLGLRGWSGELFLCGETVEFHLPLPGLHNLNNMLAAAAATKAMGVAAKDIAVGLKAVQTAPGRSEWLSLKNRMTIFNDCYNANPESMLAALRTLASVATKRRLAVLGDMAELGKESDSAHQKVLEGCASFNMDRVFLFGPNFSTALKNKPRDGFKAFDSLETLKQDLKQQVQADDTILIKGSRSMQMERITEFLQLNFKQAGGR